jgi:hypothetical protein
VVERLGVAAHEGHEVVVGVRRGRDERPGRDRRQRRLGGQLQAETTLVVKKGSSVRVRLQGF